MGKVRYEWNLDAFHEMRRDPFLQSHIDNLARGIAQRAGPGFSWKSRTDENRHRAIVFTGSQRAQYVNARDNTLLKALGGGK